MIPPLVAGGARVRGAAHVYLLRSYRDRTFYLGWTTDPLRRLAEHNAGLSRFTQRKRPWQLIGVEASPTVGEAKAYERVLKRHPRRLALFKKRLLNQPAAGRPRPVVG